MKVITNADDLGASSGIDKTIFSLHEQGLVSSTTLLAAGNTFTDAAKEAREYPGLGVGVHLCLDGPFNIGHDYATLIDKKTGQFYSLQEILYRLKRFSVDQSEIYKEYSLQIEKVINQGISISHLDHHHHLHLYFPALLSMIKAAKKYNIKYIRSQRILLYQEGGSFKKAYRNFHQFYAGKRIGMVDGHYAPNICRETFEMEIARLKRLLSARYKTVEIMLHTESADDPETRFLTHPEVRKILSKHEILNYHKV